MHLVVSGRTCLCGEQHHADVEQGGHKGHLQQGTASARAINVLAASSLVATKKPLNLLQRPSLTDKEDGRNPMMSRGTVEVGTINLMATDTNGTQRYES